jgi:hypothetical protein
MWPDYGPAGSGRQCAAAPWTRAIAPPAHFFFDFFDFFDARPAVRVAGLRAAARDAGAFARAVLVEAVVLRAVFGRRGAAFVRATRSGSCVRPVSRFHSS